ncbi:unnamed protein product [Calypogeia fissa]
MAPGNLYKENDFLRPVYILEDPNTATEDRPKVNSLFVITIGGPNPALTRATMLMSTPLYALDRFVVVNGYNAEFDAANPTGIQLRCHHCLSFDHAASACTRANVAPPRPIILHAAADNAWPLQAPLRYPGQAPFIAQELHPSLTSPAMPRPSIARTKVPTTAISPLENTRQRLVHDFHQNAFSAPTTAGTSRHFDLNQASTSHGGVEGFALDATIHTEGLPQHHTDIW